MCRMRLRNYSGGSILFERISGITIKDSIFKGDESLHLFKEQYKHKNNGVDETRYRTTKSSVVFGRNGAGKSTLSRAIAQLRTGKGTAEIVNFVDLNNDTVDLEELRDSIFVFNESFIDEKVKLVEEGLDTIVILGEDNEINSKISTIDKEQNENLAEEKELKNLAQNYTDVKNSISPVFWENQVASKLKGEGNWAERDREIKGNRSATPVHKDTYETFIKLSPEMTRDELLIVFEEKKKKYFDFKKTAVKITDEVSQITYFPEELYESLCVLLSEQIEQPELNEREERLLNLLSEIDRGEQHLKDIEDYFENEEHTYCPYCVQDVSIDYRKNLSESIKKLLSKTIDEHKENLYKLYLKPIELDFAKFNQLDKELLNVVQLRMDEVNKKIHDINILIDNKVNNPYSPINRIPESLIIDFEDLNKALEELENNRVSFNSSIDNINGLKEELIEINNQIAYYDIKNDYKKIGEAIKQKEDNNQKLRELQSNIEKNKRLINELNSQKENTHIAVDEINRGLSYIFFSDKRLMIQNENGKYYLLSRGKRVSPARVSVGERNAIALCYFFTTLQENREQNDQFKNEYFLVIDDPISSFDMENRIGMISYLKSCLQRVLSSNKDSRVILMTHDRLTYYDFLKFMEEIMNYCKEIEGGSKLAFKKLELSNGILKEFSVKSHGYTELIEHIYDFATLSQPPEEYSAIGNEMRKILEAFSTFLYKEGIASLTTNAKILSKLDEPYRTYFENLMYRLVLHGESHLEDDVKAVEIDFFAHVSEAEKQKTAKDLLVLLYLLNDLHVLMHLKSKNEKKVVENIEAWKNTIK